MGLDFRDRSASVGYLMHWAARLSARLIDKEISGLGVSAGQLTVFFALGDGGSMTTTALARAASIEQPTMTNTLTRMEKAGLIERKRHDTDARSHLFSLTPVALEKARVVSASVERTNAAILEALPEADRASFLTQLFAIVNHMDGLTQAGDAAGCTDQAAIPDTAAD